jgi:hypothetical protein
MKSSSVEALHRVASPNGAGLHDVGIDPRARKGSEIAKIPHVVLGDRAQDAGVMRQIALRQDHVDATWTGDGDAQDHFLAEVRTVAARFDAWSINA